MRLAEWLNRGGVSSLDTTDFMTVLGITRKRADQLVTGKCIPTLQEAYLIVQASDGQVTYEELFPEWHTFSQSDDVVDYVRTTFDFIRRLKEKRTHQPMASALS